ncbi:prolipoprotein diacylglyceryl transferase [Francisella tularensis]|uniref:Phosphatidylglycerol--prolipoprotein diacylglyceryl transferase n=4 Tax=Francisella tularensis TaxID=263 RepID=LGT_FRATT|nr:prolipoprotein diacylglyceryl transferase [Francisella tularensis]Q14H08.1 RecName: Full=Phosphatidylglycerol--prolipoprotein diacylglyceryl transferase [Francisella tularensis subsp. tularensis FSC198]Q5NFK6.1 RecName: Full=Phosphatidylglycerol--prolipoprotein diacylglyceryl transferase [Francisella tularensis subsp. tularensis SCHU S4]AAV29218.1 NT02FT1260 [synthetic construct]ADA78911.1 prolipoprotein diacylglyceryl transferase [Francisella tularensis subsp. tularensis NE061598]AFB79282.
MLQYPHINPVALQLGPIKIHWYGLMYLLGIFAGWYLTRYRAKVKPWAPIKPEQVGDLTFYVALGVILGGRIGYIIFYNLPYYFHNPSQMFFLWDGGMSFHGGFIGVLIAFALFARKIGANFFDLGEFVAPVIPIGLGAGRIGNFINGELWGKVTDSPLGMVFPTGGPLPRYPSQLFEFFFEGVVLFSVLWLVTIKKRPRYLVLGLFMFLYGCARFICEFFRQPDPQYGYIFFNWMTMGQILSIPMILLGAVILIAVFIKIRKNKCKNI